MLGGYSIVDEDWDRQSSDLFVERIQEEVNQIVDRDSGEFEDCQAYSEQQE